MMKGLSSLQKMTLGNCQSCPSKKRWSVVSGIYKEIEISR